ncbi:MAG: hypothetical protein V4550_21430 [Gemmatimonadota bacterium]
MRFPSVRLLIRSATAISLAGCSITSSTDQSVELYPAGIQAGSLAATASTEGIVLSNQTDRLVFFTALEREFSTLVDLNFCVDVAKCDPLVPGERRTVPWARVMGYASDRREYVVYWWYGEPSGGAPRANGANSVIVKR